MFTYNVFMSKMYDSNDLNKRDLVSAFITIFIFYESVFYLFDNVRHDLYHYICTDFHHDKFL